MADSPLVRLLARDLKLPGKRVRNVLKLLEEGCSVPFIARYRKDRTGNLGEGAIRRIRERANESEEFEAAKSEALRKLEEEGRLTDQRRRGFLNCSSKEELEDLLHTCELEKVEVADPGKEVAVKQLSMMLQMQINPRRDIDALADKIADPSKGIPDADAAIGLAVRVLAGQIAANPEYRELIHNHATREGMFVSRVVPGKEEEGAALKLFFDFSEPVNEIPAKSVLSILRGTSTGVLTYSLEIDHRRPLSFLREKTIRTSGAEIAELLGQAVEEAYHNLMLPPVKKLIERRLLQEADGEALFGLKKAFRNLLLSPPARGLRILAIDPGFRGGCRMAAIDEQGNFIDGATIYLGQSKKRKETARDKIFTVVQMKKIDAICIGMGPGHRQAEGLARDVTKSIKDRKVLRVSISRSGIEKYAASEIGRAELPELDEATRAVTSLARRVQDPLRELVKVDPCEAIPGSVPPTVDRECLRAGLAEVVESCVNFVGVDLNKATVPMLAYVSGLTSELAEQIVKKRDEQGPFKNLNELLSVPGVSPPVFEQAAGFLRIVDGEEPLDSTGIHPEDYDFVRGIIAESGMDPANAIGNIEALDKVNWSQYEDQDVGRRRLKSIRGELRSPSSDPRSNFNPELYQDGVESIDELSEGAVLPGTVTNVTKFGAFVDLGIRMEGLIHVSQMSRRFIKDPARVVSVGDRVMVKVLKIDKEKKRISLSIKQARGKGPDSEGGEPEGTAPGEEQSKSPEAGTTEGPENQGVTEGPTGPGDGSGEGPSETPSDEAPTQEPSGEGPAVAAVLPEDPEAESAESSPETGTDTATPSEETEEALAEEVTPPVVVPPEESASPTEESPSTPVLEEQSSPPAAPPPPAPSEAIPDCQPPQTEEAAPVTPEPTDQGSEAATEEPAGDDEET